MGGHVTRRWLAPLLAGGVAFAAVASTEMPAAESATSSAKSPSYLALGDSLAVGFQPDRVETTQGYVDVLWRSMRKQTNGLKLRNVSCVGETSRSMITGKKSECHYASGSQLDEAVSVLKARRGHVSFITIDVGSNDLVNRCLNPDTGAIDKACAVELRPHL